MSQKQIEDFERVRVINLRGYRWFFTWNNYQEKEDWEQIFTQFFYKIGVIYYVYRKEEGEMFHTKHLQGYFGCKSRIYKNTITSSGIPWYVDPAKGGEEKNYEYCTKQGDFTEFGTRIQQKSVAGTKLLMKNG